jgi:hypothetical protein
VVDCGIKSGVGPNRLQRADNHVLINVKSKSSVCPPLGIKPRCDPERKKVNEKGMVVETLTHSINRRHGRSGQGDRTVSSIYPYG